MAIQSFPALGVKIEGQDVYTSGFSRQVLGPLAGAQAEISDPTRHRRVAGSLTTTVVLAPVLGPLPLLGLGSKKSKSIAFVVFPDGTVHQENLDGNMMIRAAQREVAQFNALAKAAALSGTISPAASVRAEPYKAIKINFADFSPDQRYLIGCANAGLQPNETALDAAAGVLSGAWGDEQIPPCQAAIVVTDRRVLIQSDRSGGYKRRAVEYGELSAARHEDGGQTGTLVLETSASELRLSKVPARIASRTAERVTAKLAPHRREENAEVLIESPAIRSAALPVADEIRKFADLHADGILTDAEFAAKKKQLLGEPPFARPATDD